MYFLDKTYRSASFNNPFLVECKSKSNYSQAPMRSRHSIAFVIKPAFSK